MKAIRCTVCHSDDVVADAWAKWNPEKDEWEIDDVFDTYYCKNCEGECITYDDEKDSGGQVPFNKKEETNEFVCEYYWKYVKQFLNLNMLGLRFEQTVFS